MSTTGDHRTGDPKPPWRRLTGLGFEFFGVVLGFVLLGAWIDRSYDTSPRGVLICAIVGIFGGLYNLIRSALQSQKSFEPPSAGRRPGEDRNGEEKGPPAGE